MWPVSPALLDAITSSHTVMLRADVTKGGKRLYSDLPVVGGSITMDASRGKIARRACDLRIAPRLPVGHYGDQPALPRTPWEPLGHYGQQIWVRRGVRFPSGMVEWVPLGMFRIDGTEGSLLGDEPVQVSGVSREADVSDDIFASPRTYENGSSVQVIQWLIQGTLPDAEVVPRVSNDGRLPRTVFEEDRWEAIQTVAAGIGAVVYADPAGRFIIDDQPGIDSPAVWKAEARKNLVSAKESSGRNGVYNRVVVRGDNFSSDDESFSATAVDANPTSPTFFEAASRGGYGRVTKIENIRTLSSQRAAYAAARGTLARLTGGASDVDLSSVPNPALEGLDVIDI